MATRWKKPGTAVAATAWAGVCAYLFCAWPSLVAVLEVLGSAVAEAQWLIRVPRAAFLAIGLITVLGLALKDRWLRAPTALAVDTLVATPALAAIALLLEPFLAPAE